jgi:hypothetical protein
MPLSVNNNFIVSLPFSVGEGEENELNVLVKHAIVAYNVRQPGQQPKKKKSFSFPVNTLSSNECSTYLIIRQVFQSQHQTLPSASPLEMNRPSGEKPG